MSIFIAHANAHQKGPTAEEPFKNPADKMSQLVDISQPLFLARPVLAHYSGSEVKGTMHRPNSMGSLS